MKYRHRFEFKSISGNGTGTFVLKITGAYRVTLNWNSSLPGISKLDGIDYWNDLQDPFDGTPVGLGQFVIGGHRNPDGSPVFIERDIQITAVGGNAQGMACVEYLDPIA